MSPRHILLTGATGFIGRRLQTALLDSGRTVSAIVRPGSSHTDQLHADCSVTYAELSDPQGVETACAGAEAIIYCAGSVRGRNLADFNAANVGGITVLTEVLNQSAAPPPLLLISSLAASRAGLSHYAQSKFLGEQALKQGARFPWSIFRPPAVYGPGDKEMLPILRLARKGIVTPTGPPGQRLSLLHADDLASACLAWLDNWQSCAGQTFTLDDGRPGGYDWRTIAETVSNGQFRSLRIPRSLLFSIAHINQGLSGILSYAPMLTPGKARELTQHDWLCDNSDMTRATGWTPAIDLAEGAAQLFD